MSSSHSTPSALAAHREIADELRRLLADARVGPDGAPLLLPGRTVDRLERAERELQRLEGVAQDFEEALRGLAELLRECEGTPETYW